MASGQVLIVAGGGGGGSHIAGGGGGGGIVYLSSYTIVSGVGVPITIGAGGAGGASGGTNRGANGGDSVFGSNTAVGGGGGGSRDATSGGESGRSGGSGGGACCGDLTTPTGGTATSGQGNNGGSGPNQPGAPGPFAGAGGGGAGAVGGSSTASTSPAGSGGAGATYWDGTGAAKTYAGGGGGGIFSSGTAGSGGSGGGGAGSGPGAASGTNGTANTGGGGGGNCSYTNAGTKGGDGGSGICIVRTLLSDGITATGGTHTSDATYDYWTFTASGTWTPTVPAPALVPSRRPYTPWVDPEIQACRRSRLVPEGSTIPSAWFPRGRSQTRDDVEAITVVFRGKFIQTPEAPPWMPAPRRRITAVEEDKAVVRVLGHSPVWMRRSWNRTQRGRYRVANDAVEGYTVRIGSAAMPDLTAPPDGFSPTLPVAVAITPPLVDTVLFVVTRKRNKYGVESQNTHPQYVRVDTAGDETLGSLTDPDITDVVPIEDEYFRILASYPGYTTDKNPADEWRVYVKQGSAPVPGVDSPVATDTIRDDTVMMDVGPYATGGVDYYFLLTVYRTEDGSESNAATLTLTLPSDPSAPTPTMGAFEIE